MILLTGCPFESNVPLAKPNSVAFDASLRGEWSNTRPDGSVGIVAVTAAGSIAEVELRESGSEPERLRAWLVTIGDERFLNIDERKNGALPGPFVFARYSVSASGDLTLRFVGDKAVPKELREDQKNLVAFIKRHLGGSELEPGAEPLLLHRAAPRR